MAITRYAGDRFTIANSDTKPTNVMEGAFLIDTGNLTSWVLRGATWTQLAGGGGGGGTPGGSNTQVQFNNNGSFGGDADLTFTNGNRLNVNKLGISGNIYDSNNSVGNNGMVLTNQGETGVQWKNIESVLSGVGGSGVANYVARWSDEDTITTGVLVDNGTNVGIGTAAPEQLLEISATGDAAIQFQSTKVNLANDDPIGSIIFKNNDTSGSNPHICGKITSIAETIYGRAGLAFSTGRTNEFAERMRIRWDGNVGIGTNAPLSKFNILGTQGNWRVDPDSVSNEIQVLSSNAPNTGFRTFRLRTNETIFDTGGSERMRILSDGKVGIGTTNPGVRFHLVGAAGTVNSLATSVSAATMRIQHNSASSLSIFSGNTASSETYFQAANYNGTTAYVIALNPYGGSVGIGTNAPADHLQVKGSGSQSLRLTSIDSHASISVDRYNASSDANFIIKTGGVNKWRLSTGLGGNDEKLTIYDDIADVNMMSFKTAVGVGVGPSFGTREPEAPLHILGGYDANNPKTLIIAGREDSSAVYGGIQFEQAGGDTFFGIGNDSRADRDEILIGGGFGSATNATALRVFTGTYDSSVGTERLTILSNGSVGIGTNNPGYPLTVANGVTQARADLTLQYLNNIDSLTNTDLGRVLFRAPYSGTGNNVGSITLRTGASAYRTDLRFKVKATGGSERQGIIIHGTNDGALVGIGQLTDPTFPFQVSASNLENGPAKRIALFFDETDAAAGTGAGIALGGYVGAGTDPGVSAINDFGVIQGIKENSTLGNYASAMRFLTRQNSANPAEQMRITSAGRVGIGTTSPDRPLHVYGGGTNFVAEFESTDDKASILLRDDTTLTYIHSHNGYLSLGGQSSLNANNLNINSVNGNVGINNTTPEHKLHVAGDAIISGYLYDSTNSTGVDGYVLTSKEDGPQWKMIEDVLSGVGGNGTANYIPKWEDEDTIGDSVISQSGSNIGINITDANPATELHIGSTGAPSQGENWASLSIGEDNLPERRIQINAYRSLRGSDWDHMGISFQPHTSTNHLVGPTITGMAIDYDGHVGIGTNTPVTSLEVVAADPVLTVRDTEATVANASATLRLAESSATNSLNGHFDLKFAGSASGGDLDISRYNNTSLVAQGVRIKHDGNVGIGTTNPSALLHINGTSDQLYLYGGANNNIRFYNGWLQEFSTTGGSGITSNIYYDGSYRYRQSDVGVHLHIGNGEFDFRTSTSGTAGNVATRTQRMVIANDGNVGIGTATPGSILQIKGDGTLFGSTITVRESTGTTDRFYGGLDANEHGYISLLGSDNTNRVYLSGGSSISSYILNNVGIGTNNPSSVLHVSGGSATIPALSTSHPFTISNSANSGMSIISGTDNAGQVVFGDESDADIGRLRYDHSDNSMRFWTNASEKMRIKSDGKVGIGTTNPIYTLHIKAAEGIVRTDSTTGTNRSGFQMANTGGTGFIMATSSSGTGVLTTGGLAYALQINKSGGSTDTWNAVQIGTKDIARMTIDESGNVGIGTNNPTGKFQIGANYTIPGTSYGGDDIYIANTGSHSDYDPSVTNTDDFRALITISDGTTTGPTKPGLILYNDDTTAGGFSPMLLFAKREAGASPYKAASAAIYARSPLGTGNSNSWIDGELIFATAGAATQGIRQRMVINKEGLVGIGTNNPGYKLDVNGTAHITTAQDSVAPLTLKSTYNGSTAGPLLDLYRKSGTPADGDNLGTITFTADTNVGSINEFARIESTALDVTDTTEDGALKLAVVTAGTLRSRVYMDSTETVFNNASQDFDFRVESDNSAHALFVQGSDGNVGIGTTSPQAKLEIYNGSISLRQTGASHKILGQAYGPLATFLGGSNILQWDTRNAAGNVGVSFFSISVDASGNIAFSNNSSQTYTTKRLSIATNGALQFGAYGSGTHTGTAAYKLAVDSSGNLIETAVGSGQVDGSGTTNYVAKWTDGDTIGNSSIFDNGSVGIGTNNPASLLQLGTEQVQGGAFLAIRRNGDSINFGHSNGAGYGSVLGCSVNNGYPHLGFMCEAGTNNNTFRTRGLKGNVIYANTSGTLIFGQVTNANADNQSVTTRVAIESDGDAYFYGGNWFCNTNNSTNVSNGGLYINRGGGLYAYALAAARSGTALNGVDFWDYHGEGLVFGPDSSTKVLTVKSNVGIGTTAPEYLLHVQGTGPDLLKLRATTSGSATAPKIHFEHSSGGTQTADIVFDQSGQNKLKFTTYYQSATDGNLIQFAPADTVAMTIRGGTGASDGFVGIGTVSPAHRLDVNGGSLVPLRLVSSGYSGIEYHNTAGTWAAFIGTESGGGGNRYNSAASKHTFYNNSSAVVTINSSGNVGIGTTSPSSILQIKGDGTLLGSTITVKDSTGTTDRFYGGLDANQHGYISLVGSDNTNRVYLSGGSSINNYILNNVGIGTNAPANSAKLDVRGRISVREDSELQFGTHADYAFMEAWDTSADRSPKKPIAINPWGGSVGIGTTSPAEKLEVLNGAIRITNTAAAKLVLRGDSGNSGDSGEIDGIIDFRHDDETYGYRLNAENWSSKSAFHIQEWRSSAYISRLYIDKEGNVGIGTTNPTKLLTVNGQIGLLLSGTARLHMRADSDRTYFEAQSGNGLRFTTTGGGSLDILNGGSVGIGTTSPNYKLQVVGTFRASDSGYFAKTSGTGLTVDHGTSFGTIASDIHYFKGNVGINQTTPYNLLHVNGNGRINSLIVGNSSASNTPAAALHIKSSGTDAVLRIEDLDSSNQVFDFLVDQGLGFQIIDKGTGSSTNPRLTIDTAGNVGIGITAPANKLEVNFTGDDGVRIQNTASSHASLYIDAGTGGVGNAYVRMTARDGTNTMTHWINLQSNGNLVFRPAATGTAANQIIFNQNGSIGIGGTPTSGNKLFVNGNSFLDGTAYVDDALTVDGNINFESAGQYITFYGNANAHHSISSRNSSGAADDDIRINTYGGLFINLDSNGNDSSESHSSFQIGRHAGTGAVSASDLFLNLSGETGKLRLYKYGSGTHTGTVAKALGVDSSGNVIEFSGGTGTVTGSGTDNYVPRWNGTTALQNSSIYARDDGHVGIGTTGDGTWRLRVEGGFYGNGMVQLTNTNGVAVYNTSGASRTLIALNSSNQCVINQHANTDIPVKIIGDYIALEPTNFIGAAVEAVRVIEDGNVGIGITNPGHKLHVKGSGVQRILVESTDNQAGIALRSDSSNDAIMYSPNSTDDLRFYLNAQDRVTFKSGGNVGIGTATPRTNLHVYGTGVDNGLAKIRIGGNTNNTAILELAETQNGSGEMTYGFSMRADGGSGGGSTNDFQLRYHNSSTSGVIGMTMQRTTGQVGIGGVYSGTYRLYVYGDGYMTGNLGLGGTLTEASSLAIKENIETFEPSLDIINKIRPVKYDKKTTGKKEIGLIAEELAELFPELVEKDKNGNPSGVNYSRAVTVLLGGFKELYKEVQELKKRI